MTAIIVPKEGDAPLSTPSEGHARCPHDGCSHVDAVHAVDGGTGERGKGAAQRFIYQPDCGKPFTATVGSAVDEDRAKGIDPRWTAGADRSYSMPSKAYQDNYARIFGHD